MPSASQASRARRLDVRWMSSVTAWLPSVDAASRNTNRQSQLP